MKLHLGCGNKYLPGYKHVDLIDYEHIDYVNDAEDLSFIETSTVEQIYACHILEHFSRHKTQNVLAEWNRVLKSGGSLYLAVPDFEAIVHEYIETGTALDQLMGLLYGGQNYEYNYHFQTFDFERLERLLSEIGFQEIKRYHWKDFLPPGYDDFSRAYLPHMDTENGRLMSLNITAVKK